MKMRCAIVVFPGSNCDQDLVKALDLQSGLKSFLLWHKDTILPKDLDILFIPGGFSFGDYLRCGAIAANSPIMKSIVNYAQGGGYVIGICNGFQILTESGLLEGTLLRNSSLSFLCKQQELIISNTESLITKCFDQEEKINLPIAHHDGNYFAEDRTLHKLEENGQILLRYADNPNGSKNKIAGIVSENRRIIGLMPHPERAVHKDLGSADGARMFNSLVRNF